MFGKKKPQQTEPVKRKGADLMSQMGFGPVPGINDLDAMVYGDDDDDDLEAELAALANEGQDAPKKAKTKRKGHAGIVDIEKMAAVGLEDVDEDVSDTDDPDLLAELEELEDEGSESFSPSKTPQLSPSKEVSQASPPQFQKPSLAPGTFQHTLPPPVAAPRGGPPALKPLPTQLTPDVAAPRGGPPALKPLPTQLTPGLSSALSPVPSAKPVAALSPKPAAGPGGMVGLLEERLNMYKQAVSNAKTAGDSSKQRRLDRGIKSLNDLIKQAKAGKPVSEDEIPPAVAMGTSVSSGEGSGSTAPKPADSDMHPLDVPSTSAASIKSVTASSTNDTKQILMLRREQYRKAALSAKQSGNMAKAGQLMRIAKTFDSVIEAVEQGKPVDLSKMPSAPTESSGEVVETSSNHPTSAVPVQRVVNQAAGEDLDLPKTTAEEEKAIFHAPDAPKTVMEALTQRLEKYKTSENAAKTEGDSGKARRMGRIIKQYEEAIKQHRSGKPVNFDDLPTPPGFAPIPVNASPSAAGRPAQPPATASKPAPTVTTRTAPAAPTPAGPRPSGPAVATKPSPSAGQNVAGNNPQIQRQNTNRKSLHSRQEQQLAFLKERLEEFKQAAIKAKKNHDIELAKKYVRVMKGLEPMIDACESGLPVDLSQVPASPAESNEDKFVIVTAEDCQPTGDKDDVYKTLQEDLVRQISICVTNAQHYQKMGDVPSASRFQTLEQHNRRDLDALKSAHRHGDPAPRFHYESRTFSMVQCNTDLGDNDLELTIVRGIQFNIPSGFSEKDMDTCVKYEFAFPAEEPQVGSTSTVKDTVNPEYNEIFKLQFNRKSKALLRFVERKNLKLDIFIKRGFFKGDKLLGTVNVKLQPLETQCTVHESHDLVEGRKSVGGKLEVKLRIRDPLKTKQVDEVKEKWLVIDQFIRTAGSQSQAEVKNIQAARTQRDGTTCMEVLRFEKQMLDKQIAQLKDSLNFNQTQTLKHKSALLEEKIELQQKKLREGGIDAYKAYMAAVKSEAMAFEQEARQLVRLGDVQKAELMIKKKKFAEKEIAAVKAKIPDA